MRTLTKPNNNKSRIQRFAALATALVVAGVGATAHAQSADAIIDKLVDKGILTVKEANELREESDKGFAQAQQVKTGMPDWVTSMRLYGDVRGRYEGIFGDNNTVDRNRFRYRLRTGVTATLEDNFEVGFRLTSSEPAKGGVGGDPISGNTTMGSNGSKKFVYIDLVYGKWNAFNNSSGSASFTVGKMENPFVFSDMVFDGDYTPEGLAQQFTYNVTSKHTLKLNLGEFVLNEVSNSNQDPFLFGAQLRLDSVWTPKLQTSFGLSGLNITDATRLTDAAVPNQNAGNIRTGTALTLANNYNPIVVDGAITYNLDSFPCYKGAFPIKFAGDYMNNPAAAVANEAYSVGVTFGKSGKKGLWDLSYRWKTLEGDAWYEELVDSDFGGIYSPLAAGKYNYRNWTGAANNTGYAAGTNLRGHIIKASYSPADSFTISLTYFLTEVIDQPVPDSVQTGRIQLDALWKF